MSSSLSDSTKPDCANDGTVDWTSLIGLAQLEEVLRPQLLCTPAQHQLVSTAKILVGKHVMCMWATGEGKAFVFYLQAMV